MTLRISKTKSRGRLRMFLIGGHLAVGLVLLFGGCGMGPSASAAQEDKMNNTDALPKTAVTIPPGREVATPAGGCFWCTEAIFQELKGVDKVEPGYAGGHVASPSYELVCTWTTGHAE